VPAGSDVKPDRLISERMSLVVGDTEFVLIPVRVARRRTR